MTIKDGLQRPTLARTPEKYPSKDPIAATYERMVITWQDPKDKKLQRTAGITHPQMDHRGRL